MKTAAPDEPAAHTKCGMVKKRFHWRCLSGGDKEERLRLVSRRYEQARCGGGQGSRTPDPYVANVVLSQLS
jgi:hypothetical protein